MNNPWLDIEKPDADFNVRLVGEFHPLQLYWGRDTQGRYLFIYESTIGRVPDKKSLPQLAGMTVAVALSASNAKLVLILNEATNWELFCALCLDLVRATSTIEDEGVAAAIFLRRLTRWQEFLKRERTKLLSKEAIKGLVGELLFLNDKVAPLFGWDDAIKFWKGPEDAPQDFAIHNTAVEIKCQAGGTKPTVRISSVEQLVPQLPVGYLVVYTIATAEQDDPNGFTLNGLVSRIRKELTSASETAREQFEDLLFMAGYLMREEYDEFCFMKVSLRCFRIEGDFPRISTEVILPGIERVSYALKIEACVPFEAKPTWWKD
ncbi:PD-(D/E)XK motif protein [Pontiellaceae bacterium B1224]|nr:PD-(D/E)XK motif protein [Pontiellaceae bacterium B1224]